MKPQRPTPEAPRGSWLVLFLVATFVLCCLAIGLLIFPQLFITVSVIMGVIALQYLMWGWWMERLYRGPGSDADQPDQSTHLPPD